MNMPIFITKYVYCVFDGNVIRMNQWIKEMIFLWEEIFKEKKQNLSDFHDLIWTCIVGHHWEIVFVLLSIVQPIY